MPKIIEQWVLFKYVNGEFTPQAKPFKTKEQAEWARLKTPGAGGCGGRDANEEVDLLQSRG